MELKILSPEVQDYIFKHADDAHKIALAKSPFEGLSSTVLAGQVLGRKKIEKKLPSWFASSQIYYPQSLSLEQCSSEETARYKAQLCRGKLVLDMTMGFGVDSFYFSKKVENVLACEINTELAQLVAHNFKTLGAHNIQVYNTDGLSFFNAVTKWYDTIYLDPARRNQSNKVFMLEDCQPNVITLLALLLERCTRILIKTSPLLDLQQALKSLKKVVEVHLISVRNELKELVWVIEHQANDSKAKIICSSLNKNNIKTIELPITDDDNCIFSDQITPGMQLYEPDVALLKSGAFRAIGNRFKLHKLDLFSHLYLSDEVIEDFPGRIFKINKVYSYAEFKKQKNLSANIICRNFPEKPEQLSKRHKITPSQNNFLIFSRKGRETLVFETEIVQHY